MCAREPRPAAAIFSGLRCWGAFRGVFLGALSAKLPRHGRRGRIPSFLQKLPKKLPDHIVLVQSGCGECENEVYFGCRGARRAGEVALVSPCRGDSRIKGAASSKTPHLLSSEAAGPPQRSPARAPFPGGGPYLRRADF